MALAHGGDETDLLFLGGHLLLLEADPCEPTAWDALEDEAPDERECTDSSAVSVLLPSDGHSTHVAATVLNDNDLDGECQDEDSKEHWVVEESFKDVVLLLTKLPCVDLVEKLHEDEGLEDDGVHLDLLCWLLLLPSEEGSTVCHAHHLLVSRVEGVRLQVGDVEDITTLEEKDEQDSDLEDGLTDDISPHGCVDDGVRLRCR